MPKIKDIILETKKIEWSKIKDLQPIGLKNDYHSDKTKQSIIENGFSRAIYVWLNPEDQETYIIDGHLRTDLLNELVDDGYDVPNRLNCTFLDLPDKQTAIKYLFQVFNTKTNPINKQSMDDWLSDININIEDINVDIEHLHIEIQIPEIQDIETAGDDDIPESAPPITRRGDIYDLGGVHRVMCGDSTNMEDINKLMDGSKADMVFTDPPYGMCLDADFTSMKSKFKGVSGGTKYQNITGDHEDFDPELINTVFSNFDYCKEVFLWGADYYADLIPKRNQGSWVVWDKRGDESADKMFGSTFELCWSRARHKRMLARIKWAGIFGMEKEHDKKRVHPTQKPVDLVVWFFDYYSMQDKNIVADLFLGSGSTLIACEKTNRKCYGMELDEKYCDIIIKRYIDFCIKNDKPYSIFKNGKVCKEFEAD